MGLAGGKQELADHDSVLWLKNLRWMKKVKRKNEEADLLVEQPADPQSWKKDGDQQPTFLETEDMEELFPFSNATVQGLHPVLPQCRNC